MIVAFNAVASKSGGALTYLFNLVRSLKSDGTQYVVFVPVGAKSKIETGRKDLTIIESSVAFQNPIKRLLWDQLYLRWYLYKNGIDVLISTSDFGVFFAPCPQILLVRNALFFSAEYRASVLYRKPIRSRVSYHARRMLVRLSVLSADRVMVASKAMLAQIEHEIAGATRKSLVNPFGVPIENVISATRMGSEGRVEEGQALRVLYVSEYMDYKNLATLLRATKDTREDCGRPIQLLVTMDPSMFGSCDSVTCVEDSELAAETQIDGYVEFLGGVPYSKIWSLYAGSDIFVFPSLVESYGHPLTEAMASGLPIIASDIPVHREICGDAALYFDPHSQFQLANCIRKLRDCANLRAELGEIGRQRARMGQPWCDYVKGLEAEIQCCAAR